MELVVIRSEALSDLYPLGEGGYGLVYKARHADWGTVAYKKLRAQFIKEGEEIALKKEAEIQGKLNHSHIVKLLGVVFELGNYGLVLEFMEMGEICDYIRDYEPSWELRLSMIGDIVQGMSYLHSLIPPIIHGDLKTQNILVGANLNAKICDFGFAEWRKSSGSHSSRRVRFGTISHIPPEIWNDPYRRKNEKFDVYSIGICMWEILTGRKPFEVMLPDVIRESVLSNKRPDLELIPREVPRIINDLIGKCWEQDAAKRPTASQMETVIRDEINIIRRMSVQVFEERGKPIIEKNMESDICSIDSKDLILSSVLSKNIILGHYQTSDSNQIVAMKYEPVFNETANLKNDLMTEARIHARISHPHIIKFIGVHFAWTKSIVMEYASMGSLDAFLRRCITFSTTHIIQLMHQTAQGMAYLHEKRIIHCSLAARNILLVSEKLAKISDFGYSKPLQPNQIYYLIDAMELEEHLKWNAPEIHRLQQISLKSDVWSFGITLWEALSYGSTPYHSMTDDQVHEMIDGGQRLQKPRICPSAMYSLMHRCWNDADGERPTFQKIASILGVELETQSRANNYGKNYTNQELTPIPIIDVSNLTPITAIAQGDFTRKKICRLDQNGATRLAVLEVTGNNELSQKSKKQAQLMVTLRHDFIANLIGVCETDSRMMLVVECALVGPMDEFLRHNLNTPIESIMRLLQQVVEGMVYLENNRVVHCCLAAGHILLVSEQHAKISNFGFSEKLDSWGNCCNKELLEHDDYLKKWLAPESLKQKEFSSKSDVFSFGIVMWESVSRGAKPLKRYEGGWKVQVSNMVGMDKPADCPEPVYYLMLECWFEFPQDRPNFKHIDRTFKNIFKQLNIQPYLLVYNEEQSFYDIEPCHLTPIKEIHKGHFGHTDLSICQRNKKACHAVIRTADKSKTLIALTTFTHEMQIISTLSNKYIAKNIGICVSQESVKLVVEASEFGSLLYFINNQHSIAHTTILHLMYQVAQGMAYLEENRILHLNLEAANIYLLSENHATIGNFQMSKRLDSVEEYHCINIGVGHLLTWKWSAPEFVSPGKVNSKSDVWSYGSTLWEVLSNGNFDDASYLFQDDETYILPKPRNCSYKLYKFMLECWRKNPKDRPSFDKTVRSIGEELYNLFCVKPHTINVLGKLDEGVFGSIMFARYTNVSENSLVTVEDMINLKDQVNHLSLMLKMRHDYIVRFIGFCQSRIPARLMELPLFGRLDQFLADNRSISTQDLDRLIHQVAQGMAHLENSSIVHLNLRLNNIRLLTPNHAKIHLNELCCELPSGEIHLYLSTHIHLKLMNTYWRWTAPECLKYLKANSKSDVWSFGIFAWQVMSHGMKPYENRTCDQFYASNSENSLPVLDEPRNCSRRVYDLMLSCWKLDEADRPTFMEIRDFCQATIEANAEINYHETNQMSSISKLVTSYDTIIDSSKTSLRNRICRGNFGCIMQGIYFPDNGSERKVVFKTVYNPDENYEASTKFVHELHIMSMLRHENILDFIGICDGDRPMLVIEFAEFESLREFLIRNQTTPLYQVLALMIQVLDGMAYMNTRRIVHQSLKAANVLLTSQVRAKISNFEFSQVLSDGVDHCRFTQRESFVRWTAPECFKTQQFYLKSDVFSFGVTLWEATSFGKIPYEYKRDDEVQKKELDGIVLPMPDDCPQEIYKCMLTCWRADPDDRPAFKDMILERSLETSYVTRL